MMSKGLDISPKAVENAKHLIAKTNLPENFSSKITLDVGDFFAVQGQYHLIFDYTFLCALPPIMRKDWAKTMSKILHPDGG